MAAATSTAASAHSSYATDASALNSLNSLGIFTGNQRQRSYQPHARNTDMSHFLSSNDFAALSDASAPPPMAHLAAAASGMGIDLDSEPSLPPANATRRRNNNSNNSSSSSMPAKRSKRGGYGSRGSVSSSANGHAADRLPGPISEASPGRRLVCSLWLQSEDPMQCRFAVKNDDKASNQELHFVQANGYVEYKARYCKKRGQQAGYGYFHISFLPYER